MYNPKILPENTRRYRRNTSSPTAVFSVLLTVFILLLSATAIVLLTRRSASAPPSIPADTEAKDSQFAQSDLPAFLETDPPAQTPTTEAPATEPPVTEAPATYTDVTLLSAGDIMFHYPILNSCYDKQSGTYSFTEIFQYLNPIVEKYDYAVANLETTLSGKDRGYTVSGSTMFNSPDSALDAIKGAGFDMMLFANNHTYDRGIGGVTRTVSFLKENGVDCIGAVENKEDEAWKLVNVNGTKVGMLNYTNDGSWSESASGTLNGNVLKDDHDEYINIFYLNRLDDFYDRAEKDIADVRAAGADLVVFYIHWGPEYYTEPRTLTKKIAQTLCDMGVDAIIGSHPHVIQPMETLTSTVDPNHQTVCFYSLGNFISNQNRASLSASYCKGNNKNTENGLMVVLTIRKYSTGQTMIIRIETIPTWVHRYKASDGKYDHRIIPLADAIADPDSYGLKDSSFGVKHATEALAMTADMLDSAVAAFNQSVSLPAGTEEVRKPS